MQDKYFKSDRIALYLGDTLEILKKFPDDYFNMIFADPPYHLSNGGFTVHAGKKVSVNKGDWDKSSGVEGDKEFHNQWISECRRVLNKNGTIWISGTFHSIFACGNLLTQNNFKILNDICWYKPDAPPNLSCRYFTASHETLIWARKHEKYKHTFNYSLMKNGEWHEKDFLKNPQKQMRSVWSINTPSRQEKVFGKHPTQKPVELLKRIVISSTEEEDIVLDPFTGSSTTGVACLENNRKFVGIDNNEEYLQTSIKRIQSL